MSAEVIQMPLPQRELSEEQKEYWWNQLEVAERQVEYARRMLGILAVDKGLEG